MSAGTREGKAEGREGGAYLEVEDGWAGVGGAGLGVVEGGEHLLEEHTHHGKHGHTAVLDLGLTPLLELLESLAGAGGGREGGREGGHG